MDADETIRLTMQRARENPTANFIDGVTVQDLADAFAACAWEITVHGEPAKARASNLAAELASLRARIAAALKVCDVIETVRHDAPSLEDPSVVRLTRRIREILEGR